MVNSFSKTMAIRTATKKLAIVPIGLFAVLNTFASASVTEVIPGANYKILHSFDGINTGSDPFSVGITLGKDGGLYGTTLSGGKLSNGQYGSGTVYKTDNLGNVKVLHVFDGIAGGSPTAAVTLANDGSLYGTTYMGGKQRFDTGVIYKIDVSGKFHVVHSFDINSEGRTSSEVAIGRDGNLYGTTFTYGTGGSAKDPATVYKVEATGKYSVLHRFDEKNRELPVGGVFVGQDGGLYGATILGNPAVLGTIYKIAVNGSYQVVHQFNKAYEGNPNAEPIMGNDGSLYGTTSNGGIYGYGTVYRIDANGNFSILHHFDGVNGLSPFAVSFGKDGKLYGVAGSLVHNGFEFELGPSILYKVGLDRSFKILYVFKNPDAQSKLTLAPNGNFYGTERSGGQYNRGTVFRIGFPLPTSLSLTPNKLTLKAGEALTLNAAIGSDPNLQGTLAFFEAAGGAKYLGYAGINNGKAVFSTTNLMPGTHSIYAQFQGDGYHAASISKPVVVTVIP